MASLVGLLLALFAAGGLGTYILKRFVIDPIREYRNVRKEISRDLVDYANLIANPGTGDPDRIQEAEEAFRSHASELKAAADDIPAYSLWARIGIIPPKKEVSEAKSQLIGLSNSLNQGDVIWNDERKSKVKNIMGL